MLCGRPGSCGGASVPRCSAGYAPGRSRVSQPCQGRRGRAAACCRAHRAWLCRVGSAAAHRAGDAGPVAHHVAGPDPPLMRCCCEAPLGSLSYAHAVSSAASRQHSSVCLRVQLTYSELGLLPALCKMSHLWCRRGAEEQRLSQASKRAVTCWSAALKPPACCSELALQRYSGAAKFMCVNRCNAVCAGQHRVMEKEGGRRDCRGRRHLRGRDRQGALPGWHHCLPLLAMQGSRS